MTRILIAEDDPQVNAVLERGLHAEGFETTTVTDGVAAGAALTGSPPDLLILDLGLPKKDGMDVLPKLRAAGNQLPVIILTASSDLPSKLTGLDVGADDYVTKPFVLDELLARVRARLRTAASTSPALRVAGITLDLETHWASRGDRRIELSAREFALLETFLRHPDLVLTREILLSAVWGFDYDSGSNVVEVYVGYLRRKLGSEVIETVRGAGYRLGSDEAQSS